MHHRNLQVKRSKLGKKVKIELSDTSSPHDQSGPQTEVLMPDWLKASIPEADHFEASVQVF